MARETDIILNNFPCDTPYRYINEILEADTDHIVGKYHYKVDEYFYQGHFKGNPITPGAILLETMAQIGLLAFGMYLSLDENNEYQDEFYLVSSEIRFNKIVKPNTGVIVHSEKIFYKHKKLKCNVTMQDEHGTIISKGIMSGMSNKGS